MKRIFLLVLILISFGLLAGCATTPLTNAVLYGRTEEVRALLVPLQLVLAKLVPSQLIDSIA